MRSGSTPRAACMEADVTLLDVRDLRIGYRNASGEMSIAVDGVSFTVAKGEAVGIVGESGCGKSTLARALMAYTRPGGKILGGEIMFGSQNILKLGESAIRSLRGRRVVMVPQDPLTSLTYHMRVGAQIDEILKIHRNLRSREAYQETIRLFRETNLPDPEKTYRRYPHENSGGQRQRVVISGALACEPALMILDEPTTALDTTTEMQVLKLVKELRARLGMALVYITHDLTLTNYMCDKVLIMLDGRIVEQGKASRIFAAPKTDYGKLLVAAVPQVDAPVEPRKPPAVPPEPLLTLDGISFRYPSPWSLANIRGKVLTPLAVDDVSFNLAKGETLGLVGESGSGKSTVAGIVAGLMTATSGDVIFDNRSINAPAKGRSEELRRRIQFIFQDPMSSLNPRRRVQAILTRPLQVFFGMKPRQARDRAAELLESMELSPDLLSRFPRQLSGGQQQRVAIARAFAASPDLILCDEITSALDVSVQAHILELLAGLQQNTGVACLFISHDLGVVKRVADYTVVLKSGRIVEEGSTATIFDNPAHDYTRLLLAAASRREDYAELAAKQSAGAAAPAKIIAAGTAS